jgi:hypothetical protein
MAGKIYWYPTDVNGSESATRCEISFSSATLAAMEEWPIAESQIEWPPNGIPYVSTMGASRAVTLEFNLIDISDATARVDLYCAFRSIERHLQLGGWIGFAQDTTYAGIWPIVNLAGTAYEVPAQGDTTGDYGTELLGWEGSAARPAELDTGIVVFESACPEFQAFFTRIDSWAAGAFTVHSAFTWKVAGSKCYARNRWFYPRLYLAKDAIAKPFADRVRQSAAINKFTLDLVYTPQPIFDDMGATP